MASENDDGHGSVLERAVDAVAFLRRLDRRNLRMLSETLLILAGPALRDWQYNSRLAARELPRASGTS
jgi:hypothetical protein